MRNTVYIGANFNTAEYIYHCDKYNLIAVICEKNKMTDEMLTFTLVRKIELYKIGSKKELVDTLKKLGNEYIYIMHIFGLRIPIEDLDNYKIYNIHPSNLPAYKGPHPTYWETVNNETQIGVSIHEVTEKLDEGGIIGQEVVPYYLWENELVLQEKVGKVIPSLLEKLNIYLDGNNVIAIPNKTGNYYPKVTRKEVFIDVDKDSPDLIFNKVRAEANYGGAKIVIGDVVYCLKKILFKQMGIVEESLEESGHLYIRYKENLVIDASVYRVLESEFKFSYEK